MDHHNFIPPKNEVPAEIMQQANLRQQLGATGKFPDGQLSDADEGELQFSIGELDGRVVLNFGKPVQSCGFTLAQAREVAYALRRHANVIERRSRHRKV